MTATDSSGAVRVVLGHDGLPESVSVEAGWLRALGSERFATAVGEAARAAVEARDVAALAAVDERDVAAMSTLVRDLERVMSGDLGDVLSEEPARPRPLPEVLTDALDVMSHMTALLDQAQDGPASGTGSTGFGKLALTLSSDGTLACVADSYWVSNLDPAELNAALSRALAGARADLAAATPAVSGARLDELGGELRTALRHMMRSD